MDMTVCGACLNLCKRMVRFGVDCWVCLLHAAIAWDRWMRTIPADHKVGELL